MDYFRKYISQPPPEEETSGAETIERLVDRVQSSTLVDDRRDALRALKSLSKKYRLEVGTQAMHIVMDILSNVRGDNDIAVYGLDILYNILNDSEAEYDDYGQDPNVEGIGVQFTEMLLKTPNNISILVSYLDEFDFSLRRSAVQLLTLVLRNRQKIAQECILMCPMGISKTMDLLSDAREVIRNDSLLLLQQLTCNNTNIQKIVAFENAFERILSIVREEGLSDGGVVVEDCLQLLMQLLKNNPGNQTLFKEGSFIQRLVVFFELDPAVDTSSVGSALGGAPKAWPEQKVSNVLLMLQTVRSLLSPSNKAESTRSCQQVVLECRLMHALCSILMAPSGIPAPVLTETIHTVAEAVRGFTTGQRYLAGVVAPSDPPQPAITVLLMSMVNERQPFDLRQAVLYCFQCFLYNNPQGQRSIVETLLPKSMEESDLSAGQLLCNGLFGTEPTSTWFAAVALAHAIRNNVELKEELLRVHLATSLGRRPVSLLHQLAQLLSQHGTSLPFQAKVGVLTLLCTWMHDCPAAVDAFLAGETPLTLAPSSEGNNSTASEVLPVAITSNVSSTTAGVYVSHVMSELTTSESEEKDCIIRGLCALMLACAILHNHNHVKGFESGTLVHLVERRVGRDVFLEHISQVGKSEAFLKANKKPQPSGKKREDVTFDYEFTLLFKGLEHEISRRLREDPASAKAAADTQAMLSQYAATVQQQDAEIQQLRTQISTMHSAYGALGAEVQRLRDELQLVQDENLLLKASQQQQQTQVQPQSDSVVLFGDGNNTAPETGAQQQQVSQFDAEYWQAWKNAVDERDATIVALQAELSQLRQQVNANNGSTTVAVPVGDEATFQMQQHFGALQAAYQDLYQTYEELRVKHNTTEQEKAETRQEHEDLLVLLAEQDTQIKELRKTVRTLGGKVEVSSDDSDADEITRVTSQLQEIPLDDDSPTPPVHNNGPHPPSLISPLDGVR